MVRRVLVECAQVKTPGHQYRLDAFLALFFLGFPDSNNGGVDRKTCDCCTWVTYGYKYFLWWVTIVNVRYLWEVLVMVVAHSLLWLIDEWPLVCYFSIFVYGDECRKHSLGEIWRKLKEPLLVLLSSVHPHFLFSIFVSSSNKTTCICARRSLLC